MAVEELVIAAQELTYIHMDTWHYVYGGTYEKILYPEGEARPPPEAKRFVRQMYSSPGWDLRGRARPPGGPW